jgi:uncharacterized protein (TIGR03435 family)
VRQTLTTHRGTEALRSVIAFLCASLPLCVVVAVGAQDGARFDAASIKVNTSGSGSSSAHSTRTQLQATNISLMTLIRDAYGMQEFQIIGAPDWVRSARFDVLARGGNLESNQYPAMLRNLLADRFGLVARVETRELPVYALVVAREGRLGPQIAKTTTECHGTGRGDCGTSTNNRSMKAVGVGMASLARTLSAWTGRTVLDNTRLEGEYDLTLQWASDAQRPPTPGDNGPSIFTALQEQLGLKLDPQKGPVEAVVITSVTRPTED